MISYNIPVQPIPSQQIASVINNQACLITLNQIGDRQYFTLELNGSIICRNILIQYGKPISGVPYTGLIGDFYAIDLQGDQYPEYTGWGDRWVLLYLAN